MKESTKDTLALCTTIVPTLVFVGACVLCPSLLVPTALIAIVAWVYYVFFYQELKQ